jgi:hypothetical protein
MSDVTQKPGTGAFWITFLAVIGCFLIFLLVLYVAYLPSRPQEVGPAANLTDAERLERNLLTPGERKARLDELRAREQAAARGYAWIDQEKGIVRLPIERAVELTATELQGARTNR